MNLDKVAGALANACLLVACAAPGWAGPWLNEPGSYYAKIEYSFFRATESFDANGHSASLADERFINDLGGLFDKGVYTANTSRVHIEVGVLHGLEIFSTLPLVWVRQDWSDPKVEQNNYGIGDWVLGARVGRSFGVVSTSLMASLTLPLYDNDRKQLNYGPGNLDFTDNKPVLGQGTIDGSLRAAVGVSTLPLYDGWASFELGPRFRNRQYATGLTGALQLGWRPRSKWALIFDGDGLASFENGDQPRFFYDIYGKGPAVVDGQSRLALGLGALFELGGGLDLELGIARAVVGRRTSVGDQFRLGLSTRR